MTLKVHCTDLEKSCSSEQEGMDLSDRRKDLGRIKETFFSDGEELELHGRTPFFKYLFFFFKGSNTFSWDVGMYEAQRQ